MLLYPKEIINNKEYLKICPSNELIEKRGKKILFDDSDDIYEVAIFRIAGKLYCSQNLCPHQAAPRIFEGILKGTKVTCPLHGWSYNLPDGSNCDPKRGIKSLQVFEIIEENGWIYIEIPKIELPRWRRA